MARDLAGGSSVPARSRLPELSPAALLSDDGPRSAVGTPTRQRRLGSKGARSPSNASTSPGSPVFPPQRPSSRSGFKTASEAPVKPRELKLAQHSSEFVATAINCVRVSGAREVSLSQKMDDLQQRRREEEVRYAPRPQSQQAPDMAEHRFDGLERVDVKQWNPVQPGQRRRHSIGEARHIVTEAPAESQRASSSMGRRRGPFSDALGELLAENPPPSVRLVRESSEPVMGTHEAPLYRAVALPVRSAAPAPPSLPRQTSEPVLKPPSLLSPLSKPKVTGILTGPPSPYNGKASQLSRSVLPKPAPTRVRS